MDVLGEVITGLFGYPVHLYFSAHSSVISNRFSTFWLSRFRGLIPCLCFQTHWASPSSCFSYWRATLNTLISVLLARWIVQLAKAIGEGRRCRRRAGGGAGWLKQCRQCEGFFFFTKDPLLSCGDNGMIVIWRQRSSVPWWCCVGDKTHTFWHIKSIMFWNVFEVTE